LSNYLYKILLISLFILIAFSSKSQKLDQRIFDIKLPFYVDNFERKIIIENEKLQRLKKNTELNIKVVNKNNIYKKDSVNILLKKQLSYFSLECAVSFLFYLPNKEFKFNIIIALTENLDVLYFIDYEQNTDNKNKFKQIEFNNNKSEYKIMNTSFNNINYILKISNPYYQKKRNQNNIRFIENTKKIHSQTGFSASLAYGYSEISYTPIIPDSVFSIYYNANIKSAYSIKSYVNVFYKKINLSFILNYQKLYFEDNTRAITSISSTKKIHTNYTKVGFWPSNILYLTFCTSYDFHIKNNFYLSPTISFSHYLYINANENFDDTHNGTIENNFNSRFAYSLGFKLKYAINYKYSIFTAFNYNTNLLDASSYFNNIDISTYMSRQITNNFELGFYYMIR